MLASLLAWALAGCEPLATQEEAASKPGAQAAAILPARPAASLAAAYQNTDKAAATTAQLTTIHLPAAPRLEVPQVTLPDAAAAQRINKTLTRLLFSTYLEDSTHLTTAAQAIRRATAEYKANQQMGIFSTSFEVLTNQGNLLSLALTTEYSGAYPSSTTCHATFDLHTGYQVTLASLLTDTLALRRQWHSRINARLAAYRSEVARAYATDPDAWASVRNYTGWSDTLRQVRPAALPTLREFALTSQGLVLYTSFEFPHVVQALAPPDAYLFSYAGIRPWLAPQSLLRGRK